MKRSISWMRVPLAAAAAATLFVAPGVLAGAGTRNVTGPSGAQYSFTITCATKSATARVDLSYALNWDAMWIEGTGFFRYGVGVMIGSTPANWVMTKHSDDGSTSYSLIEESTSHLETTVIGPTPTSDCPSYPAIGAAFVPLTPERLLDTRSATSVNYTGPKPGPMVPVELQITGRAGIPLNAVAVALNVTLTESAGAGYVQVYPTGQGTPGASSNLNAELAGQTIPNAVIVPIGLDGRVTLFSSVGTHLIADVSGYFVDVAGPVAAGRYTAITPRRVLDTRTASAVGYAGAKPSAGAIVRVRPVATAGLPPGQVAAVVLNITATESSGAGYVQAAPAGALVPGATSNLNVVRAGQTIPNLVTVPVSAAGEIELFTQSGTHLIVDVFGWFSNGTTAASTSGLFVPVIPERVLDTRPGSAVNYNSERLNGIDRSKPEAGEEVSVDFDGLPWSGVGAVVLNITATESSAAGFVQGGAYGSLVPGASSNLNLERAGQTIPNAAILPGAQIVIYTQTGTNLVADISGFFRS